MRIDARLRVLTLIGLATMIVMLMSPACSKNDKRTEGKNAQANAADSTDEQRIQAMFHEAAVRWHHGDKAVLYDLEFEYLQQKSTYDDYLNFGQISYLEADTLIDLIVKSIQFFPPESSLTDSSAGSGASKTHPDSAYAVVDAIFVGPTGDTSVFPDKYRVYYHRGRWIHPTMSVISKQLEYEDLRRVADSAAAAEAEMEGN